MSWPCPHRRRHLLSLYCEGRTFREIAAEYGGTAQGVRSTIRKMRERGDAPDRRYENGRWVA